MGRVVDKGVLLVHFSVHIALILLILFVQYAQNGNSHSLVKLALFLRQQRCLP